ncbi:MAG: NAD(P)-dependent oxidoreductase [Rikenellaceae bacterium]
MGVGNVGTALSENLKKRGYEVLHNDPPRAAREENFDNTPLDKLLQESDMVTLHTPLDDTTRNLASTNFFNTLGKGKFFINASRGEVTDEKALLRAMEEEKVAAAVIDVWHKEPEINELLLERALITTPHIAGYSEQGKANGTAMMVAAVASFFGLEGLKEWYPSDVERNSDQKVAPEAYDILSDSKRLKNNKKEFEELRNGYKYRKEFF